MKKGIAFSELVVIILVIVLMILVYLSIKGVLKNVFQ